MCLYSPNSPQRHPRIRRFKPLCIYEPESMRETSGTHPAEDPPPIPTVVESKRYCSLIQSRHPKILYAVSPAGARPKNGEERKGRK